MKKKMEYFKLRKKTPGTIPPIIPNLPDYESSWVPISDLMRRLGRVAISDLMPILGRLRKK